MWAIHVVHHSSERYNLSTALRQPVADALGTFVPYGLLCAASGIRPALMRRPRAASTCSTSTGSTPTRSAKLGPFEEVFNTPSHHRVHHGSNHQYLDRNHGSILIIWDRLFGTFEREDEPVVYGLTKNIDTYNPAAGRDHEHADMLRDVARSTTWRDRLDSRAARPRLVARPRRRPRPRPLHHRGRLTPTEPRPPTTSASTTTAPSPRWLAKMAEPGTTSSQLGRRRRLAHQMAEPGTT